MSLTKMEVFTPGITLPPFPIVDQDVSRDPFQIKSIDGLGPVKASVNTTQYGSVDGEFYNGSFTPKRNIVISVGLNPDWATQTIEDLRQILYSYFMPQTQVRLKFTSTHLADVEISGYVEACDPNIFSKDPDYLISVICPQADFIAVNATVVPGETQAIADPATDVLLDYEGSSETGFIVTVTLPDGATNYNGEFRIVNSTSTTKLMIVDPVIVSNLYYFSLSSLKGNKFAREYPLPSGTPTNELARIAPGSSWLTLRQGINKIQVLADDAGLTYALSYYARYGGL